MGITWIFEILSWALGGADYLWYVTDAINCLRGLFVFVIYSGKKKVFVSILNRLKFQNMRFFITKSDNVRVGEHSASSIEMAVV